MKYTLNNLLLLIIGTVFGIVIHGTIESHSTNYHLTTVNPYRIEYVFIEKPTDTEETEEVEETFYRNISAEDCELLEQIAMAEAENQDTIGKALVILCVLNRCEKTGKTVREVIYAPHQFYTAGMKTPDDDAKEAMAMVLEGWDESQGALYFCSTGWNKYGDEHLFVHQNHYFSR